MVGTICALTNLNIYSENHGKRIILIFVFIAPIRQVKEDIVFVMKAKTNFLVLIDPKRQVKEDFVFVMKAKTHILNVLRRRSLFKDDDSVKHSSSFQT